MLLLQAPVVDMFTFYGCFGDYAITPCRCDATSLCRVLIIYVYAARVAVIDADAD